MDANFAARVPEETLEDWDQGDVEVTDAATRYLRRGNPDAGFVYLGVVDESAHLVGSATPAYTDAIGAHRRARRPPAARDPVAPELQVRELDGDRRHRPRGAAAGPSRRPRPTTGRRSSS